MVRVVLLGNGIKGAEGQCEGLIRALNFPTFDLVRLQRPRDLFSFAYWVRLLPAGAHVFLVNTLGVTDGPTAKAASLAAGSADRPTLVIAAGRDTVPAAVQARRASPSSTIVVQIQHPRVDPALFDLVLCPEHDADAHRAWKPAWAGAHAGGALSGPRVALTKGALHRIDATALRSAREALRGELSGLPRPLLAICAGGPHSRCQYSPKTMAAELAGVAEGFAGSVRATVSRRTPKEMVGGLGPWLWNEQAYGESAYPGLLAWCDAVVVTADSVSMLSEAASLGKPMYVAGGNHCTGKFRKFVSSLLDCGVAREAGANHGIPVDATGWRPPKASPWSNATQQAAEWVRQLMERRGWEVRGGRGGEGGPVPNTIQDSAR